MSDPIRLQHLPRKARLPAYTAERRAHAVENILDLLTLVEADETVCGMVLVVLHDDGKRRDSWNVKDEASAQMVRQLRRTAASITKQILTEDPT